VDPAQRYQTAEEFRGRLNAVLAEIDPSAGPESCSKFMRDAFSAEYNSERKLLASLREQRLGPPPAPIALREVEPLGAKKDVSTAVKNLTEMARRSMEMPFGEELTPMPTDPKKLRGAAPPPAEESFDSRATIPRGRTSEKPTAPNGGLSFAPTPRLKEDDGRASATDRETMPSINLMLTPAPPLPLLGPPVLAPPILLTNVDAKGEPITSRAVSTVLDDSYSSGSMPIVGELIDASEVLQARPTSPWSANETTAPAGLAFDAQRESPMGLPAVMTSEPSETYEPGRVPVDFDSRSTMPPGFDSKRTIPAGPFRPVVAPLPQALKNKAPPPESAESTGKTIRGRSGFMWVVIPLVAVLAVAAFVLKDVYEEQLAKGVRELERNSSPLGPSTTDDRRSREVAPQTMEAESPESATDPVPGPAPEPTEGKAAKPAEAPLPPPSEAADGELLNLVPKAAPAVAPVVTPAPAPTPAPTPTPVKVPVRGNKKDRRR
jgi:eukaryotic-like serine/threonine-protein kinase